MRLPWRDRCATISGGLIALSQLANQPTSDAAALRNLQTGVDALRRVDDERRRAARRRHRVDALVARVLGREVDRLAVGRERPAADRTIEAPGANRDGERPQSMATPRNPVVPARRSRLGVGRGKAERLAVGPELRRADIPARRRQARSARRRPRAPATGATSPWLRAAMLAVVGRDEHHRLAVRRPDRAQRVAAEAAHRRQLRTRANSGWAFRSPSRRRPTGALFDSSIQSIEVADRERLVDAHLRLRVLPLLRRLPVRLLVGRARPHRRLEEDPLAVRAPSRRACRTLERPSRAAHRRPAGRRARRSA